MRLPFVFCLLCLSCTTPHQKVSAIDIQKLKQYLSSSELYGNALFKTVTPSLKNNTSCVPLRVPSQKKVDELMEIAKKQFQETEEQNKNLTDIDKPNNETATFGPHLITDEESLIIKKSGSIIASVTDGIVHYAMRKKNNEFLNSTSRFQMFDLINRLHIHHLPICPYLKEIKCNSEYKYRTIDGRCNNLNHPYWGKSHTPFERFLTPQYEVTSDPRARAESGDLLPEPRSISLLVHEHSTAADSNSDYSYMVMQWGQFSDHDITKTALSKAYGNRNLECCETSSRRPQVSKYYFTSQLTSFTKFISMLMFANNRLIC